MIYKLSKWFYAAILLINKYFDRKDVVMAKSVTLADIAKRLGVSNVTVSKALADKEGVSEQLRLKIKALALEMGYKQNVGSKGSREKRTCNVGVLIPECFLRKTESFYWKLYQNVVMQLTKNGLYNNMEILSFESERDLILPQIIQNRKVDALIIIGQVRHAYLELIRSINIPAVFLDFYEAQNETDCIISDGFYGMYKVTSYLIENGHRNIAFVGSILATSSITDRYFGYMKALMEHGIEIRKDWIIEDRDSVGEISIKLPEKMPTAFACNCDLTAYTLINILTDKGYDVPEDISIVGFDNYIYSDLTKPAITTYEVDMPGMAKECVDLILKKIQKPDYKANIKIVTGNMIVKESVRNISARTMD